MSIKWNWNKNIADLVWGLIFPRECIFCGEEDSWMCQNCFSFLEFKKDRSCLHCHHIHNKVIKGFCPQCRSLYFLDGTLVAGDYKDKNINKAIKLLKYRFIRGLASDLGDFLTSFLYHAGQNIDTAKNRGHIVVPIPLHWKRKNWRGFNQAYLLGERLSYNLDLPFKTELKRISFRKPQTKLKKEERRNNIKNSFVWQGEELHGKTIWVVDDVITTGSTMNEAARTLKHHGARKVIGVAVAGE